MDLISQIKSIVRRAMMNMVWRTTLSRVDGDGQATQIVGPSGRTTPEVEVFQPQGLHFKVPNKGEGIGLSPLGVTDSMVVVCAADRKALPADSLGSGEGGLHLLGTYKVFIAADGSLHLGEKDPSDWVSLASLVDAEFTRVNADLTTLKAAIAAATVTPADGGASFKSTLVAALATFPTATSPTGSTNVKCS